VTYSTLNNRGLGGAIDDVLVFGRQLAADEVTHLFHEMLIAKLRAG
jgi:hypothetical protein